MDERWTSVTVGDGRSVEVRSYGPDDGVTVVFHLGTPGAAAPFPPLDRPAVERGLRVVSFSRPGYAGSTPRPGRSVADNALDTAAVLDALGVDRFLSMGWSGGGPHALADAAVLPDRCAAVACLAGVAPYDADGLDFLAGMGPENLEEFAAAAAGSEQIGAFLEAIRPALATVTGDDVAGSLGELVGPLDRAAMTGEFAATVAEIFRRALSTGIEGWRDDDLAFVSPWGFSLQTITTPVSLWQGEDDRMVPFAHGRWLADQLPNVHPRLSADDGHLTVVTALAPVLDDLMALAGTSVRR